MKLKTPILRMYYGELISPDCVAVNTKEHEAFLDELVKTDEEIQKLLKRDDTVYALYKKAMDCLGGMMSEEVAVYYAEGFRAGILLGMDIAGYFDK
ncbi:MAG: hypothetical protein IJF39_04765 [Clostridia bacterium]|nr:hypothetical protein [Clostridia bacterium]